MAIIGDIAIIQDHHQYIAYEIILNMYDLIDSGRAGHNHSTLHYIIHSVTKYNS